MDRQGAGTEFEKEAPFHAFTEAASGAGACTRGARDGDLPTHGARAAAPARAAPPAPTRTGPSRLKRGRLGPLEIVADAEPPLDADEGACHGPCAAVASFITFSAFGAKPQAIRRTGGPAPRPDAETRAPGAGREDARHRPGALRRAGEAPRAP